MIILIGSEKGGCGKSTTATNICALLAGEGKDVCLVDADQQSTSSNWIADRDASGGLPKIHCVQKYGNIRDTLLDLNARYEFVIVDAAGRDSKELRTAMTAADTLVIPFRPSQADLDTLANMVEHMESAKIYNPNLVVKGLITMAPTNPVIQETSQTKKYLNDLPAINLLRTVIFDRKIYRDAVSEGLGVTEMKNQKAKSEIQSLMGEIA